MRTSRAVVASLALAVAGALLPAVVSAAPAKAKPKCFGKTATIVVTGNGKTVNGTSHNDVIVALGKGVKVFGKGGNDLICTKAAKSVDAGGGNDKVQFGSGKILGGAGNDTLTQTHKGKPAQIFGGAGNDSINVITKGNLIDSGTGLDVLIVAPALQDFQTVIPRDGLTINGVTPRVDAPKGVPTADIAFDNDPGPLVYAVTRPAYGFTSSDDAVSFAHVLAPNGRTLASWSIDFGDGTVHTGSGGLPASFPHSYLTNGNHVIVATQKDSAGQATTRTITVSTASRPTVDLTTSTDDLSTGATAFSTAGTAPGSGAVLTSWFIDFGDGTTTGGTNAPPATINHTYPIGTWTAYLYITDDHGNQYDDNANGAHNAPDANLHLYAALTSGTVTFTGHLERYGAIGSAGRLAGAPVPANGTVLVGQFLNLYSYIAGADGETMDWGDGCVVSYTPGTAPAYVDQTNNTCSSQSPADAFSGHTYLGPGTRTVTLTAFKTGGTPPSVSFSQTLTIAPRQTVAALTRVGVVPQGPVTFSTAGTTVAPGPMFWAFYPGDDTTPLFGTGPVPATITHVYPSGFYDGDEAGPYLLVTDHLGSTSYADSVVDATAARARVNSFQPGGSYYYGASDGLGQWFPALQAKDGSGDQAVSFSGTFVPSVGAKPGVANIIYGDGGTSGAIGGFSDGQFGSYDAVHGYSRTGDFTAILSAKDTAGQVASASAIVSVGGLAGLSGPDTVNVTATNGQPTVTAAVVPGASYGANATPLGWSVYWDDGALPSGATDASAGNGAVPASVAHAFPNPGPAINHTYDVMIQIRNDHGSYVTRHVAVVVTGA